jgi:hypothetical protein
VRVAHAGACIDVLCLRRLRMMIEGLGGMLRRRDAEVGECERKVGRSLWWVLLLFDLSDLGWIDYPG